MEQKDTDYEIQQSVDNFDDINEKIKEISERTGYHFAYLWGRYCAILSERTHDNRNWAETPIEVLEKSAEAGIWLRQSDNAIKAKPELGSEEAKRLFCGSHGNNDAAGESEISDKSGDIHIVAEKLSYADPETAKIREHNHDTLWAVLAGFAAAAAMVVIFGLVTLAILSYAVG